MDGVPAGEGTMRFTKMQGAGNDYVYVNGFTERIDDPASLAGPISDRHFGVGADGLILILPSDIADVRMKMFNPDGSQAHCGNGLRCVAKYAYDNGLVSGERFTVETLAGALEVDCTVENGKVSAVTVDMGAPRVTRGEILMTGDNPDRRVIREPLEVADRDFEITCVSMGNPHCVIYVDNVGSFPVGRYGPIIENHEAFPERTNVEFVQVVSGARVIQRTWERGAGETLACGTGACAVCAAGVLCDVTDRRLAVELLGGELQLDWREEGTIMMTGPAVTVFEGDYQVG